ncbi:Uncharacterised protein [Citrobacter freundii]|nr:Uncharacterised protein [Citrobacter freundii]
MDGLAGGVHTINLYGKCFWVHINVWGCTVSDKVMFANVTTVINCDHLSLKSGFFFNAIPQGLPVIRR